MTDLGKAERDRLAALEHYNILDTADEKQFDGLVQLASQICETPIALISLVDAKRQWFKAKLGITASETPREISACQYTIEQPNLLIIPDTLQDERFRNNPLVTGDPHMRFYAGAPLTTPAGYRIGTICVLDTKPRTLTSAQQAALETLSAQVVMLLELKLTVRQKDATEREMLAYIAERTEIERSLRESQEHLNLMVESAKDYAIISANAEGIINSWNTGAEYIFGYCAKEALGKPIDLIFTEEDCANNAPAYEMATAAKLGRASDERWHERASGNRFYASGIMAAMYDDNKSVTGFVKIARDMTTTQRTQEALLEARNEAEAANIAKTEFLANMSHEIRTPMNAIIGLSSILSISKPLTEKQRQYVKTLQLSADSLLSLINDLLDIAKIEARTVELEQIPFSFMRLIQEVISMMNVRVNEKGLKFTFEGDGVKNYMFMGDPTRIRQVVLNLCSNAIKFTDVGGIHIAISSNDTQDENTKNICIAVSDTGIGIAKDKLDTIFEKFIQADSSISRKYGGTGLGLAITKTITEIMGGTITVESNEGQGSTFKACIPLKLATEQEVQSIDGSLPTIVRRTIELKVQPHILLVEDYAPNVLVATTVLEDFGFAVDVANDGREAVDMVTAGQYVAVLMDVQMHGMNGFEATKLIRENEVQKHLPRIPIIGMTAHALAGDRERCIGSGMDDYISKPFNHNELRQKLDTILETMV